MMSTSRPSPAPLTVEETEPVQYYPGHEGQANMAVTVLTRDYAAYSVASGALADSLANWLDTDAVLPRS